MFLRYCLSIIDTHLVTGRWYNRSLYEMWVRLASDTLHFVGYMSFFVQSLSTMAFLSTCFGKYTCLSAVSTIDYAISLNFVKSRTTSRNALLQPLKTSWKRQEINSVSYAGTKCRTWTVVWGPRRCFDADISFTAIASETGSRGSSRALCAGTPLTHSLHLRMPLLLTTRLPMRKGNLNLKFKPKPKPKLKLKLNPPSRHMPRNKQSLCITRKTSTVPKRLFQSNLGILLLFQRNGRAEWRNKFHQRVDQLSIR